MLNKIGSAAAAYAEAAKALQQARGEPDGGDNSFAALVTGALESTGASIAKAEAVSMQAIANQADINEVVTAINEAEVALQVVVAVRDRVIQAYND
ncbi:MAG: flagellar hook-basal body complex protein FliE, partial [Alphaproteobacteria bacterium]